VSYVVPDFFEPLVGYRSWTTVPGSGVLRPHAHHDPMVWAPGKRCEAVCEARAHVIHHTCSKCGHQDLDPPAHKNCRCGFHAFKDPVAYMRQLPGAGGGSWMGYGGRRRFVQTGESPWAVHGAISMWGRVVEHKSGWRSQYAYPALLCVPKHHPNYDRLHESYPTVEFFDGTFFELVATLRGEQPSEGATT
jgi:hypothetical protein